MIRKEGSSSIELSPDMTAVQRWKLQTYVLGRVISVKSARAENFGDRGNILTVQPSHSADHLETIVHGFWQDLAAGKLRQH